MTLPRPRRAAASQPAECPIVEFRRYAMQPGQRDVLIDLFERELLEPIEACGMRVIGQFRELDDADRYTWLRGFADLSTRKSSLEAFYGGPVWAARREVANATMIDSDNVLLLRPAWLGASRGIEGERAPIGATRLPSGLVDATIYYLDGAAGPELLTKCRGPIADALERTGALATAWFLTDDIPNNYPRLPVREGEWVLLRLAVFADEEAHGRFAKGDAACETASLLGPWLAKAPEVHRLTPTARSAIHAERS